MYTADGSIYSTSIFHGYSGDAKAIESWRITRNVSYFTLKFLLKPDVCFFNPDCLYNLNMIIMQLSKLVKKWDKR